MAISAVGARSTRVIARAISASLFGRGGLLPTSRRASSINGLPLVSGMLLTALPLHNAVASAWLQSAIASESQSWGLVPQELKMSSVLGIQQVLSISLTCTGPVQLQGELEQGLLPP